MAETGKEMRSVFRDYVIPLLTALTAVLSAVLVFYAQQLNNETRERVDLLQEERLRKESDVDLTFKVYEAVKASLEKDDARQQEVALALVKALLADTLLRENLLRVLTETGTLAVRQDAAVEVYNLEQAQIRPTRAQTGDREVLKDVRNWNFDIFWCEESGDRARDLAEQVRAGMAANGWGATGFVRVRMLPARVNKRPGYQAAGWEIRANTNEQRQAELMKQAVEEVIGRPLNIEIREANSPTPYYLSCFICTPSEN